MKLVPLRYVNNPPNPWLTESVEWLGEPPEARVEIFEDEASRTILTRNNSPDVGFDVSLNIYRGCTHACAYCFSRPTHEYLGFGAGTDFETKIVVKTKAPELLRKELMKPSWKGEQILMSFTSDPYIPLETKYELTKKCLEILLEFRNPVAIVTKSALIRRDVDLLAELAQKASAQVFFSIPFLDAEVCRALEPFVPLPEARFHAMKTLSDAGVAVGLAIAPVIPGLNESDIPALVEKAAAAGAKTAFINLLRLPGNVRPYFLQKLAERLPTREKRIVNHIRAERNGKLNSSNFGERMHGTTEHWKIAEKMFRLACKRHGLNQPTEEKPRENTFRRPTPQLGLFD
jgi:DNA repair photolyase